MEINVLAHSGDVSSLGGDAMRTAAKGTLEAASMLAASLDGQKVNMDSDPQYDGNASLSNKRENPIWNNSLLSND